MISPLKCVVLGGGGFIGSHVVDALVGQGHSVRVFERQNVNTRNIAHVLGRIELMHGDFLNENDLCRALAGMDVVVHLVTTTLPKSSNDNVVYDIETNVIGTIRLLNLVKQVGIRKIIFASSGGTVYGAPQFQPIAETHPTTPICSHGIAKLTTEKYLHLYHHLYGLDYTVLRFANPYGSRQDPMSGQGAVTVFLWQILKGEPISIWGDGTVARDYFYISDLVSAVLAAIEKDTPLRIYNIGSGVPHTLNELLSVIQTITGRTPIVRYSAARKLDVPFNSLDISRARRELLWQPQVPLKEGLVKTWEWLQQRKAG
ncbi:MAG: NAD-dependent epimerase/dehydratase family protein [Methylobacter sp.]|uniref:NAD-dependent epimerase/dehydratase family protein n=1 Tax=Methylobacter sp. TaxID=2051955 RepID=UPI002730DA55|nr:NAD-dependent epimerase/dehydratase family protein [Methylobacter sp.]MDP1663607.1 NAD-dependent epimerase/dehydratase family protein [Methylobacter sp.]